MAFGRLRLVGFVLSSALCALGLSGCAGPSPAGRPGVLELRVDPDATYALIGRFQLNAIEPWSPSRDVDFDVSTSQARIELPPGTFALTLGAGARLVCDGEDPEPFRASVPRLVSAPPQVVSIVAGELTTAHISVGSAPAQGEVAVADINGLAAPVDPCNSPLALSEASLQR